MTLPIALLKEVVAVLVNERAEGISCVPTVERERDTGNVTLKVVFNTNDSLEAVSLYDELKYLADVANVRAFAATYGIDPAALEAVIQKRGQ